MTPTWFAVVALAASVGVGFGVAYFTNRWQRQAARDDRLADKRADAYVKLAAHTVRLRQYAMVANPDLKDGDVLAPPNLALEELYDMYAWVEAYGSDAVIAAYDQLLIAAAETRTAVAHLAQMRELHPEPLDAHLREERTETLRWVQSAKPKLGEVCDEVLKLIRSELRSKSS